MSSDEARQIVKDGLDRLRAEQTQREAVLDAQERSLRVIINENHTVKTLTETQRLERQMEEERMRRAEIAKRKADMVANDMKAEDTVNKYLGFCIFMILLAAISKLNVFVLMATILGAAVFPAIRICKIYGLV